MVDKKQVIFIAPMKVETELDEDSKFCIMDNPINKADSPLSTSSSTDVPYPVGIFENKLHTSVDKNTTEQSCTTSVAMDNLPCNFDQKPLYQMSDSDKPHTFTPQQIKRENLDRAEVGQDKAIKQCCANLDESKDDIMSRFTIKNEPDKESAVKHENINSSLPSKYEHKGHNNIKQHDELVVKSSNIYNSGR